MIGTEEITASVANISENIREVRLGWLGREKDRGRCSNENMQDRSG